MTLIHVRLRADNRIVKLSLAGAAVDGFTAEAFGTGGCSAVGAGGFESDGSAEGITASGAAASGGVGTPAGGAAGAVAFTAVSLAPTDLPRSFVTT